MNRYQILNNKNAPKVCSIAEPEIIIMDSEKARELILDGNRLPRNTHVMGNLVLDRITNAENIVLPYSISGDLWLDGLISASDLVLPKSVNSLGLRKLTSTENLILPKFINESLYLNNLISATNLFIQNIGRDLCLVGLTSAEGLILPPYIGGDLFLGGLTSLNGLDLTQCRLMGGLIINSVLTKELFHRSYSHD
jgi:hypothetical protein